MNGLHSRFTCINSKVAVVKIGFENRDRVTVTPVINDFQVTVRIRMHWQNMLNIVMVLLMTHV